MKRIWLALGDIRLAFCLLMAASATLLTGAYYAGGNFSLFMAFNRGRIQDWLPIQLAERPELVWWIPVLLVIMGLLGINTIVCAMNRVGQLIGQRHRLPPGRMAYLAIPSLIHFMFILIMIGHLTTFTLGIWQAVPLQAGRSIRLDAGDAPYTVKAMAHRFFPETSALKGRIVQTDVTLESTGRPAVRLQYTQPVFQNGSFLLLDKIKKKTKRTQKQRVLPSTADETCNKAHVYATQNQKGNVGGQLLLIVFDPGLPIIVVGLASIMVLMVVYFLGRSRLTLSSAEVSLVHADDGRMPLEGR